MTMGTRVCLFIPRVTSVFSDLVPARGASLDPPGCPLGCMWDLGSKICLSSVLPLTSYDSLLLA